LRHASLAAARKAAALAWEAQQAHFEEANLFMPNQTPITTAIASGVTTHVGSMSEQGVPHPRMDQWNRPGTQLEQSRPVYPSLQLKSRPPLQAPEAQAKKSVPPWYLVLLSPGAILVTRYTDVEPFVRLRTVAAQNPSLGYGNVD
jgi:hypothetical protein